MLEKKDRFFWCPMDYRNRYIFSDKVDDILTEALKYVQEDYADELRDIVAEIIENYEDYDFTEDDMFELFREYFNFDDILWGSKDLADKLKQWVCDDFFDKLNRNEIKVLDRVEIDEIDNE